jgi:uncharacterized protein (DUF433 family)
MTRIEIGEHLLVDSRVCGGRLIFKGTRVLVADALALVKTGLTPDQIAREYRKLVTSAAVREALTLSRKGLVREVLPKAKNAA